MIEFPPSIKDKNMEDNKPQEMIAQIGRIGLSDSEIRLECVKVLSERASITNSVDNFIKIAEKLSEFVINGTKKEKSEIALD